MKACVKTIVVSVAILLLFTTQAQAYVDPGSGSAIVTTILGLLAAIGYTCRKYFYRLKRAFSRSKGTDEKKNDEK